MNYTDKICSFTGYRLQKLYQSLGDNTFDDLEDKLRIEVSGLIDDEFTEFRCGMALGADMMFAEIVLGFQRRYPRVKLIAVVPCHGQEKSWNEAQQEKYREILSLASEVVYTSGSDYFDGCMQIRNRHLADACDLLLAVYDGRPGGTKQTVEYAKKQNKRIVVIDPATMLKVSLYEQMRL